MSVIKAMLLGAILTGVFSLVIGVQGSSGEFLYIHPVEVPMSKLHALNLHNFTFYWSWPLFIAGSGLAWALILMTD